MTWALSAIHLTDIALALVDCQCHSQVVAQFNRFFASTFLQGAVGRYPIAAARAQ